MEKLNPFLKGVSILVCGLILSFSYSVLLNGGIIAVSLILLLFFSKARLTSLVKILVPAFVAAVSIFFTGMMFTSGSAIAPEAVSKVESLNFEVMSYSMTSVYNAIQLSSRILAFAGLGVLFAMTTDGEEFVKSLMHQCRLKPKYAYGVLAAFHLLPCIREEFAKAQMAFRVRGIPVTPFSMKPVFAMLVNTVHWSEHVAMAMESKGFDGEGARTYYTVTVIRWYDWCFLAVMVSLLVSGTFLLPF